MLAQEREQVPGLGLPLALAQEPEQDSAPLAAFEQAQLAFALRHQEKPTLKQVYCQAFYRIVFEL